MNINKLEGKAFLLDNNKEYVIITTYAIDEEIYAFMINTQNEKDAMITRVFNNSNDIYVEEVHNAEIAKKIMDIIKSTNINN